MSLLDLPFLNVVFLIGPSENTSAIGIF